MNSILKALRNSSSLIVAVILVVLLGTLKFIVLQKNILSYDYFGLYLYLPATFIYHDPAISDLSWLEKINELYHNTPMFYQLQKVGDYHLIRFFSGIAILLSPFFFLGHLLAHLGSYPADGFSFPYQLAMMIAAFFYVSIGIFYARKILLHFFNETNTIFTLLAIYLGTNLLFWTTFDAGAPHTILFTMYLLLIWNTIQWHEKPKKRLAIIIGVLLGLIIASRPSEIIAIIIPLFWNIKGKATLLTKLKLVWSNRWHFVLLIISVVLMGLPQMAYYQHYTGHLFVSTYNDPQSTLDFSNPRISWVLFSYRKGLFLYAPLMIFSVLGIVKLVQRQFNIALAIVLFLFVNLIFIASFTSLISYGYRAFIQSYAILILPLGFFIESILTKKLWIKLLSLSLLLFFVWFSSIETWQIINGFIDSSRMTKAYYWKVFGKMNIRPTDKNLLMINPYLDDETGNKLADSLQLQRKVLVYHDFNNDSEYLGVAFTSSGSIEIGQAKPFSPATKKAFKEITSKDYFWARISFRYKYDSLIESSDLLLVSTFTYQGGIEKNKNQAYKYRAFKIPVDSTKVHQWQSYSVDYLSPEVSTPDDRFETYVWNRGKKLVLLDDFQITIFEPKD